MAAFFANNNSEHFCIFQMHCFQLCFLTRNINNLETRRPYKKTVNLENLKLICEKKGPSGFNVICLLFFVKVYQNICKTANKSSSIDTNQILVSITSNRLKLCPWSFTARFFLKKDWNNYELELRFVSCTDNDRALERTVERQDCPVFTTFLTIKTSFQNISITLT